MIRKHITTKRVLLFLLLLIKLAIFPHIGILFIVAAANAAEVLHAPSYRLVIVDEVDKLNQTPGKNIGDKDYYYRVVCGTHAAIDWAQKTIFKNRPWHPVRANNARDRDAYTHNGPCDSKLVSSVNSSSSNVRTVPLAAIHGKNSDRLCRRISGCAINLDALTEEEYCPTCVWRENRLN